MLVYMSFGVSVINSVTKFSSYTSDRCVMLILVSYLKKQRSVIEFLSHNFYVHGARIMEIRTGQKLSWSPYLKTRSCCI